MDRTPDQSHIDAYSNIAIVGLGLVGASLALALRNVGYSGKLVGVSRRETLDAALDEQAIDALLHELGNTSGAIPFYAIYPAGKASEPILMDNAWLTTDAIVAAFKQAGPSQGVEIVSAAQVTAMKNP